MKRVTVLLLIVVPALVELGCSASHIGAYKPKRRDYSLDAQSAKEDDNRADGSLWQPGRPASMLFTDARALRVNDLVVIKVGLLGKLKSAGIDPTLGGSSTSHFKGDGQSGRTEFLTATVPAMVRKVLPNGNLFVEGHRVILVNAEEQHFYISGVVRPIDIDQENSVKSAMVADAEIEFVGNGVLTDNQHQGWFQRYFGWIWPF